MEVSFSIQPQTLITAHFPCIPLSSLSASKLLFIRRQFLGCGHNLGRPDRLCSQRKSKRLGIRINSPRFFFRASLDTNSILVIVVAVVTFSAASVTCFNYYKRKKISSEVPQSSNNASSQLGRAIYWFMKVGFLGFRDLFEANLFGQKTFLKDRNQESIPSWKETAVLQYQESFSLNQDACNAQTLPSPGSDIFTSRENDSSMSEKHCISDPPVNKTSLESGVLQPQTISEGMTGLQLDGYHESVMSNSKIPAMVESTILTPVSFSVINNVLAPVIESKTGSKLLKEVKSTSSNFFLGESAREFIYMMYETSESSTGQRRSSSHTSFQDNNRISSLTINTDLPRSQITAHISLHTTGHAEGKSSVASYKKGYSWGSKDSGKNNRLSSDRERRQQPKRGTETLNALVHPNGRPVNNKKQPLEQLKAYNHRLREGRLSVCIHLLEEMERRGSLDMNKVYHARFFNTCKSKRAVKEAFQYIKLIPNPTLSTFNMLMSVCASSQDSEGAFQVLQLVQEAGLKADCKLYTTLISTCSKSGKVDTMFEVFHRMVNAGVEPNVHTYGALIDGCARAGQVAKAFGVYGIMRSKNVKPDRVVFNALITACGQSGAVDRAFDVLAEMGAEIQPINPDNVTVGALIKACANAGQVDRAREVYKMIHEYNIKGTPEVYTIAINCCSQSGDWKFACSVYADMSGKGLLPDEMFLSALIDVAGHSGKLDAAFEILQEAKTLGIQIGIVPYSSLMGACSNAKNWLKALELYEHLKSIKLKSTVSTMNALITALCDGDQLQKALEVLSEMKGFGLCPNSITYSILFVASEKKSDIETGLMLLSQAKKDGISTNLSMSRCIISMCLRRFEEACLLGEPVLSLDTGLPQVDNKWASQALAVYRDTIVAGLVPTIEEISQVLGCLRIPCDSALKLRMIENLGVTAEISKRSKLCALIDGFGEYDHRAFSLFEEASSLGVVPCVSFKASPIVVDASKLQIHSAEVYLLTVLKGLKHRLAAGAKLPTITIKVPAEKTTISSPKGERTIGLAGRVGQAITAMLRRLGLPYQGNESYGRIRINGLVLRRWFQPKLDSPFSVKPGELRSSQSRLGKGISDQQRLIRIGPLSVD